MDVATAALEDRKAAFDRIYPRFKRAFPESNVADALAANFYIDWAWDVRGTGYADTVSAPAWKLMGERLPIGEQHALAAFYQDPAFPGPAASLANFCTSIGRPRKLMEFWFSRSILSDSDYFYAYDVKSNYLMPKWHGSEGEVLAFGRECATIDHPRSRVPEILINIHRTFWFDSGGDDTYWQAPGVWDDIQLAYEKLLADKTRLIDDREACLRDRAKYLYMACLCHEWSEVLRLMNEFGNEIDKRAFGGEALCTYYRKKAAANAGPM
jgi:hypothetical protein